jgi:SAM-dependent methyltransferase
MSPVAPFDPRLRRMRQRRAALQARQPSFLAARAAQDLVERLVVVNRRFERVLIVGGGAALEEALAAAPQVQARLGWIVRLEADPALGGDATADPAFLPVANAAFDLALSVLSLHAVNDLPGALIHIRAALKPDGLFLGAMLGGETLKELRASLTEAELDVRGGAAARVAPFADVRDAGGLLQRAGFALPVVDADPVRVRYGAPLALLSDLRAMGETAPLAETAAAPPLTRTILAAFDAAYRRRFADADARVRASFDILTLTGWAPHASQQKPLKPGSAAMRLADALKTEERSAGEKTGR